MAALPTPGPGAAPPRGRPRGAGSRAVRIAVRLGLTVGVTWLIVDRIGITLDEALAVDAALPEVRPWVLLLSCLLLAAGFLGAAGLWGRMTGELGGRNPGLPASARIVLAANLGRYLPGKIWQMAGLALLSRREGVPGTVGGTAGVLGQSFLLAGAGVLGAPLLIQAGREGAGWLLLLGLGGLALLLIAASVPPVLERTLAGVFRLAGIADRPAPRTHPLFGLRWLALYVALWVVYGAAFVIFLRGLGLGGGGFGDLAPAFAAAYLLGYLAVFAPAGIGVREGFLIAFLRPELGAAAVGAAVLARVWMTAVELLPAGALALWEVHRKRGVSGAGEGNAHG